MIFFPEKESDIVEILAAYPEIPVTVQGARTGLTAGCVPESGLTVNMERMNRILSCDTDETGGTVTVQPGVLLQTLRRYAGSQHLFFTPDPTETTASLGGMVSCNSSGARSFKYGAVRNHVLGLTLILPGGGRLKIERGASFAAGRDFSLPTCGGRMIEGRLPEIEMPHVKKNTAGYFIRPDMDLIDMFIGAEGTLGIITSIKLTLIPESRYTFGAMLFLPDEGSAIELVQLVKKEMREPGRRSPEAMEFFGEDAVSLLRKAQIAGSMLTEMQLVPDVCSCGIYIEYTAASRDEMMELFEYIRRVDMQVGGDPKETWAAMNESHMEKLKLFRHAVPELVNMNISEIKKECPDITKLGTDMSVPDDRLSDVFRMYRRDLDDGHFQSAVFGHIGDSHLHVNIIPGDMNEYMRGKKLFDHWADEVVAMGGSVSAEHGIGKLKTPLLKKLYSDGQLKDMMELKKCFDPEGLLNRGNILEG